MPFFGRSAVFENLKFVYLLESFENGRNTSLPDSRTIEILIFTHLVAKFAKMGTEQNLPFFAGPRSSITSFFLSLRKPWKLKEYITT